MAFTIRDLQHEMKAVGHDPGPLDGVWGPKTLAAVIAWGKAGGRGPTHANLPWLQEANAVVGLHEVHDREKLSAWLKSGGKYLGDPSKLPWCGDAAETCIRRALPDEPFTGPMENPFWALNWQHFGVPSPLYHGAIGVFKRPSGGHVGFLVGEGQDHFWVLGGNQSDSFSTTRISKSRLVAARWPATFPMKAHPLVPIIGGGPVSTNEA